MTPLFNNGGFTLIELLAVVLIIGVLAAVALPQYQKAVMKSRLVQVHGVLRALRTGVDSYVLANGDDGTVFLGAQEDNTSLLDINFGASFDCSDRGDENVSGCLLQDFAYRATTGFVEAEYKEMTFLLWYSWEGEDWHPGCVGDRQICNLWNSMR